ncbi:C39 family peptidase [Streptococcus pluranimalium]|uniref:C39 family peptidase n=1 Tax=Streptococcus pluranimalium TaxID=82348 RepID=UPI0039FBF3EB
MGINLFLAPAVLADQALETVSDQTTPVVVSDDDIPATSPSEVTSQPLESAAASAPASNVVSEESQSISAILSENTMPSESLSSPSQPTNVNTTTIHLRSTTSSTVSELSKVDTSDIRVRSHVEILGWQNPVPASQLIGTIGQGKRLEALEIRLGEDMNQLGDISYQAHVQDIGWQSPVTTGGIVGTTGQGKRLEAVNLRLTQELAVHFDLYYRAHVQDYGWLSWAKNGANVGTEGLSKRLEALEIQILSKGTIFTGDTRQAFIKRVEKSASIYYRSYIEKQGWQTEVIGGSISGSTGKNQQIEALGIRLQTDYLGSVSYEAHIQNIGWIKGVRDGEISGQGGSNRQIEALKISLVGDISQYYDVYYRVHSQNKGWLGWTKNGLASGTEGFGLGIEGFEVTLVKKGAKAPKTTTAFVKKENEKIVSRTYPMPYFNQRDLRWSSKYYGPYTMGDTGCVPTSLSMVFTALTGKTVAPTSVADWLYQKTSEFNKVVPGTRAPGIVKAAAAWGLEATNLSNYNSLIAALQAGHHVLAAVEKNVFVQNGSHEIVLKGYNNGKVHVTDPYTQSLNGWYDTSYIFNTKSTDKDDNALGLPFFKITHL